MEKVRFKNRAAVCTMLTSSGYFDEGEARWCTAAWCEGVARHFDFWLYHTQSPKVSSILEDGHNAQFWALVPHDFGREVSAVESEVLQTGLVMAEFVFE